MRLQYSLPLLGALLGMSAACGKQSDSKAIPPRVNELALSDAPADLATRQKKWDDLAAALGIGNNQAETSEQLVLQLAAPSALLVDRSRTSDLQALLGRIGQKHVEGAYKTRCAAVVGASKLSTALVPSATGGAPVALPAANVYVLRYKLQADRDGAAEAVTRAGLLVLPATASRSAPLVAYAHGGDAGLAYGELATVFNALQANHVIVAPTFPGEALCKTGVDAAARSCDANGALALAETDASAYDGDADELLGMQDCIARATLVNPLTGALAEDQGALAVPLLDETGKATGSFLNAALALTVKRIGGTSPVAALPATIVAGTSRGGLVSSLAVAKSGAALQAFNADKTVLGAGYVRPTFVSCSASLSAPAALTVGELRLALEYAVKGTYAQTSFTRLPGYEDLGSLFADYRAGTMSVEDAAVLVAQRDLTLSGPLYLGALRDWGAVDRDARPLGDKGAALFLHGTLDKVFPFTHSRLAFNILTGIGSQPLLTSVAPGVKLLARGVAPTSAFLAEDGTLAAGYLDHGDLAFLTGTTVMPSDFVSSALTSQPFADAALEAKAKALAAGLFQDTSEAKLAEARALMITGQRPKLSEGRLVLDDKANLVGVGLSEAVASWLEGDCAASL